MKALLCVLGGDDRDFEMTRTVLPIRSIKGYTRGSGLVSSSSIKAKSC
jgi:hypothetical protein